MRTRSSSLAQKYYKKVALESVQCTFCNASIPETQATTSDFYRHVEDRSKTAVRSRELSAVGAGTAHLDGAKRRVKQEQEERNCIPSV
ncbi:hypothetical protein GN956_G20405 [Arapaima gigas]